MATTASRKSNKHATIEPTKRRQGRPKAPFDISGEIVPFDIHCQNKNNVYERMSDQQRQEALGELLVEIIQRRISDDSLRKQSTPQDAAGDSPRHVES